MIKERANTLTIYSEQFILLVIGAATMFAAGSEVLLMIENRAVRLADLFLLFIYAEVLGMVGAFFSSQRIPVTLPIIIAMTALCRMVVLHSKEMEPMSLIFESGAILILAASAYLMSVKDKLSLEKLKMRKDNE